MGIKWYVSKYSEGNFLVSAVISNFNLLSLVTESAKSEPFFKKKDFYNPFHLIANLILRSLVKFHHFLGEPPSI